MRFRSSESALRVALIAVATISVPVVPMADEAPTIGVGVDDTGAPPESGARKWY